MAGTAQKIRWQRMAEGRKAAQRIQRLGVSRGQGHGDDKRSAETGAGRAGFDGATVLAGELAADPEAEAGAGAGARGEEGLEEAIHDFGRDAAAVVANFEAGRAVVLAQVDPDGTALGNRIDGVSEEVSDNLANLAFDGEDADGFRESFEDLDSLGRDAIAEDGEALLEEGREVDRSRRGGAAVEAEGLANDGGDAGEFLVGLGEPEVQG